MDRARCRPGKGFLLLVAIALTVPSVGCGLLANLLYKGNMVDPLYGGLEGRKVAVVCVSNLGDFGPSPATQAVPRKIGKLLRSNVKDIKVIDQDEVDSWTDSNEWIHPREIGRGVEADMVVVVNLDSLSFRDGATLWKGRANTKVTIYDMTEGGEVAFDPEVTPIEFPRTSGYHVTSMSEAAFQRQFITVLAREVSKNFYEYDLKEDIAPDRPSRR